MKKYALHPGWVTSKTDGERHYISTEQLRYLYGLPRRDCIVWDRYMSDSIKGLNHDDYIHLHPRYHGNYSLEI